MTARVSRLPWVMQVAERTRALMALGDGLLLHRLTVDPALALRPAIERAVRALAAPLTWLAQHPDGEDRQGGGKLRQLPGRYQRRAVGSPPSAN